MVSPNWVSNASRAWIDARVVVGIDDGDGLARAVQREVVDAVGGADLGRGVSDRPGRGIQGHGVGDGVAADRQRIDDRAAALSWRVPLSTSWAAGA